MLVKCACKYITVGLFVVYGTLTLNLLSWVSRHHKQNRTLKEVLGPSSKVWEQEEEVVEKGEIEYVDKNYEDILKYMENNAKRKRKILTELLRQYDTKPTVNKTVPQFVTIGNIYVFSAFFDDRINFEYEVPVMRIMGISRLDSDETLVCRYTDTGSDSWILAAKQEMSDNHWKKYGGVMYVCNTPPDIGIIPRKIYLQSLSNLGDGGRDSGPVSLDVQKVQSGRLSLLGRLMDNGQDMEGLVNHYYQLSDSAADEARDSLDGTRKTDEVEMTINNGDNNKQAETERRLIKEENNLKHGNMNEVDGDMVSYHDRNTKQGDGRNFDLTYNDETKENGNIMNEKITNTEQLKNKESHVSIAVCIPPLFGSIPLSNFIQFMEMLHILGVSQVFAYKLNVSSNIERMLTYYGQQGFLTTIDWPLPPGVATGIWNHGQIVAVQDCLYRTMGIFDYTAFIDIDELIIPKLHSDWPAMLRSLDQSISNQWGETGCYIFQSAFFDPDYPLGSNENLPIKHSRLSFIRNIQRTQMLSKVRTKVLVRSDLIDQMGIHHVSKVLNTTLEVATQTVDPAVGLVHHYRTCTHVSEEDMDCKTVTFDMSLGDYETILTQRYDTVLQENVPFLEKIDYKIK